MKILIQDATVITMNGQNEILENACIGIEGSRICFVGELPPDGFAADKVISGKGRIVIPGLVNAHCHSPMVMFRNFASDLPLHKWMFENIRPLQQYVTPEDVRTSCMLALIEMVKGGITCFADMYNWSDVICEVAGEAGMRAAIGGTYSTHTTPDFHSRAATIRSHFRQWNRSFDGRIRESIVLHALYSETEQNIRAAIELAQELGTDIQIHISETVKEKEDIYRQYGDTTIGTLNRWGMFDSPTIAAHCIYLSDEDFAICKEKQIHCVHCPTSNMKLASGFADVPRMLASGISVCLGTDGAASNNTLSLFREMQLASVLHKGHTLDATSVDALSVLKMATTNAAKAVGFPETGTIEVGKQADLTIISTSEPHMTPVYDPVAALVYSAQASDVETVLVNGKLLMENRKILFVDEEQIKAQALQVSQRILSYRKTAPVTGA